MSVAAFTKTGTKAAAPVTLNKAVFGQTTVNHQLLKDAYLAYLANGRENLAVAKRRGQVRGGGQKPWRQKGTGRARFGSSRNPIWRGGGVAFGPTGSENYSHRLSLKAKHEALRQALSLAAQEDKIKVIETFACPDGKVKPSLDLLKKLEVRGKTLIVVSQKDDLVERATRNIDNVDVVQARYLNVFVLLNSDSIVISKKSLDIIHEWLSVPKPTPGEAAK